MSNYNIKSIGEYPVRVSSSEIINNYSGNGKRGFEAAKLQHTSKNWLGSSQDINSDIKQGSRLMRARSRELAQNDSYVKKYLGILEKYVVGPKGFTLRSKVADVVNNKLIYNKTINFNLENEFWLWQKRKYCFITQNMSMRLALYVAEKSTAIDGEIFIKKNITPDNPWGITLQLIEPGMCDETFNGKATNGNLIIMGIEYNNKGQAVAYYFRNLRKDTPLNAIYNVREYRRIPADYIIHYYDMEFVGQKRGYPRTVQVANRLHNLKGYEDNSLVNAKSAAMKVAVLEPKENFEGETTDINSDDGEETLIIKNVIPGETYIVPDGYTYKTHDPTYPHGEHSQFTESMLYGISSGLDVDFATLSSNLSKANYTSIRHGSIDSRLTFEKIQENLIEIILEPVYEWWLETAILKGKLKYKLHQLDYLNQPWFYGFKPGWIDPLKDKKAAIMGLKYKIDTYEDILAEKGKDITEHIEQLKFEKEEFEKSGLIPEVEKFEVDNSDRTEAIREAVEEYMEDYLSFKSNGQN